MKFDQVREDRLIRAHLFVTRSFILLAKQSCGSRLMIAILDISAAKFRHEHSLILV